MASATHHVHPNRQRSDTVRGNPSNKILPICPFSVWTKEQPSWRELHGWWTGRLGAVWLLCKRTQIANLIAPYDFTSEGTSFSLKRLGSMWQGFARSGKRCPVWVPLGYFLRIPVLSPFSESEVTSISSVFNLPWSCHWEKMAFRLCLRVCVCVWGGALHLSLRPRGKHP